VSRFSRLFAEFCSGKLIWQLHARPPSLKPIWSDCKFAPFEASVWLLKESTRCAKIAIVPGSTRPGRRSLAVAHWVYDQAAARTDPSFELLDIADFELPLLDEALPPQRVRTRMHIP
jgi:NADPH-dependent FMN reductase